MVFLFLSRWLILPPLCFGTRSNLPWLDCTLFLKVYMLLWDHTWHNWRSWILMIMKLTSYHSCWQRKIWQTYILLTIILCFCVLDCSFMQISFCYICQNTIKKFLNETNSWLDHLYWTDLCTFNVLMWSLIIFKVINLRNELIMSSFQGETISYKTSWRL